jgi:hypothetical protein
VVEALDEADRRVGEQRPEQTGDERGVEVVQVGVDEHDQVAGGGDEAAPHRGALAVGPREVGGERVLVDHDGARLGREPRGGVGRPRVDDDDLVDQRHPQH